MFEPAGREVIALQRCQMSTWKQTERVEGAIQGKWKRGENPLQLMHFICFEKKKKKILREGFILIYFIFSQNALLL